MHRFKLPRKALYRKPASAVSIFTILALTLAASAQAALPSLPGPDAYPRATQAIELKRGLETIRVRPLKTVRTLSKREALADRLIVVFQTKYPTQIKMRPICGQARAGRDLHNRYSRSGPKLCSSM